MQHSLLKRVVPRLEINTLVGQLKEVTPDCGQETAGLFGWQASERDLLIMALFDNEGSGDVYDEDFEEKRMNCLFLRVCLVVWTALLATSRTVERRADCISQLQFGIWWCMIATIITRGN
jgi:hypothetical protein